jgi:hypothetical protein
MNWELLKYLGILAAFVLMIFVVAWRRRSYRRFMDEFAERELCEHLRPALHELRRRGHWVLRAGQRHPQLPLEVHITPAFDPGALARDLDLGPPVHVSERDVLFCDEDFCEIQPVK